MRKDEATRKTQRRRKRDTPTHHPTQGLKQQESISTEAEQVAYIRNCCIHGAGCPKGLYGQDIVIQKNVAAPQQCRQTISDITTTLAETDQQHE